MSDTLLRCERIEAEECAVVVEVVHSRSVGQNKNDLRSDPTQMCTVSQTDPQGSNVRIFFYFRDFD